MYAIVPVMMLASCAVQTQRTAIREHDPETNRFGQTEQAFKQPEGFASGDPEDFSARIQENRAMTQVKKAPDTINTFYSVDLLPENALASLSSDTDTVKKPVLQPWILGGGIAVTGGVAGSALFLFGFINVIIPLVFLAAAAVFTVIGLKKLKREPKKYKGNGLANTIFLIIGLLGVGAATFLVYWLFTL